MLHGNGLQFCSSVSTHYLSLSHQICSQKMLSLCAKSNKFNKKKTVFHIMMSIYIVLQKST